MLKRASFSGFKSFADEVNVSFPGGITVIIGPNGCGKSNVFDGVRWVLGEQSAKSLRGGKMQDVIFSGSDRRKPKDTASVSIVLDNEQGFFPNVTENEVEVTRRIDRKGGSEYFINGTLSRLKDVQQLFMDSGVGSNSYSIIGQGQIEKILSTKIEERRSIFEEASGIVKLRHQKEQTEKRLKEVDTNLIRLKDILDGLDKQLSPLRKQSEKTKEYNRVFAELSEIETQILLSDWDQIHTSIDTLETEVASLSGSLTEKQAVLQTWEEKEEELKTSYQQKNEELFQKQEISSSQKEEHERIAGELKLQEERCKHAEKTIEEIDQQLQEIEETHSISTSEFQEKQRRVEELRGLLQSAKEKTSQFIDKMAKIESEKMEWGSKIEILRKESSESYNEFTQEGYRKEQLTEKERELKQTFEQTAVALKETKTAVSEAKQETERVQKRFLSLQQQYEKEFAERKKVEEELQQQDSKLKEEQKQFQQLEHANNRLTHQIETLESYVENNEGYFDGVKAILQAKKTGHLQDIYGAVGDLITVDAKYEKAIETLMQSSLQHIITKDDTAAKKSVQYLKEHKLGRATFLPVSFSSSQKTTEVKGLVAASDVVSCDAEIKPVIETLLKRAYIATTLDEAVAIQKNERVQGKIATLEGEVVQTSSITGGESKQKRSSQLQKRRELEEFKQQKVETVGMMKVSEEVIGKLEKEIESLQEQKQTLQSSYESSQIAMQEAEREKTTEELKLQRLEEKLEELHVSEQNFEIELKETSRELIRVKMNGDQAHTRYEKVTKELETANIMLSKTEENEKALQEEKTQFLIEEQKWQEEERLLSASVDAVSNSNESLEDKIRRLYEKREFEENRIEEIRTEIEKHKELFSLQNQTKEEQDAAILSLKESINVSMKEMKEVEGKTKETRVNVQELEQNLAKQQTKLARKEAEKENTVSRLQEEFGLSLEDLPGLERKEIVVSQARKDSQQLKKQLQNLGAINHTAIEDCEELEERYTTEKTQYDDVVQAKEDLETLLKNVEDEMVQRFTTSFDEIANHFSRIFVELFGGGKASLSLVDPKNPLESAIEIVAQPPGKKPQSINLLSGGEKAFTAVAIIFSIITAKPSPFVILDEVDAALDDANVARFSKYLEKMSGHTQFIVVTHRKGTMMVSDTIYGVTQPDLGVSIVVSHPLESLDEIVE